MNELAVCVNFPKVQWDLGVDRLMCRPLLAQ